MIRKVGRVSRDWFIDGMQVPWDKVKDRDERYEVSAEKKREARKGIEPPEIHADADACWLGK